MAFALLLVLPATAQPGENALDVPNAEVYVAETLGGVKGEIGLDRFHWLTRGAWRERLTGEGIRVGIIDTGIDSSHPDLEGQVLAWRDFTAGGRSPYDDDTHGTHVAGIIAGRGHWQLDPTKHYFPRGLTGIAPGAKLLVAKAMASDGEGHPDDVARAIAWLVDPNGDGDLSDGAHVINLSIGVESASNPGNSLLFARDEPQLSRVRGALEKALGQGVLIVVAAGNHEPGAEDAITFPGTMTDLITVGALDAEGRIAAFSNRGEPGSEKPDLVAPGVLLSTFQRSKDTTDGVQDGYLGLGGTSMAAPVVTGVLALALEAVPEWRERRAEGGLEIKAAEVRSLLLSTADREGLTSGWDPAYGHGRFDADAFLEAAEAGAGPLSATFLLALVGVVAAGALLVAWRRRARDRRAAALRAVAARPLPIPYAAPEAVGYGFAEEAAPASAPGPATPHGRPAPGLRVAVRRPTGRRAAEPSMDDIKA